MDASSPSFENTDQSPDSTSLWDVLTGAASNAASGVVTAAGDRISGVISGDDDPATSPPATAVNKPQHGPAVATAGIGAGALLGIAAGAYFLLGRR